MLKKLFHYEWLSISRYLLPLLVFTPILGFLSGSIGFFANRLSDLMLLSIGFYSIYGFTVLALVLSAAVLPVLLIYRFWSSLFSDGGYLTLMLPVKKSALLFTKLANAIVAETAQIVVLIFSLVFSIGMAAAETFNPLAVYADFLTLASDLFSLSVSTNGEAVAVILEIVLFLLSYLVMEYAVLYIGITLGAVIFKGKGRVAGAFLFVFLANSAVSTVMSVLELILSGDFFLSLMASPDVEVAFPLHAFLIGEIVIHIGFAVGLFFFNVHLTEKKMNLP